MIAQPRLCSHEPSDRSPLLRGPSGHVRMPRVSSYGLAVDVVAEHDSGPLAGMTTYQIFMECVHADDVVSSVSGDATFPWTCPPPPASTRMPSVG